MPPAILPPDAPLNAALASPEEGFSLLSYNILLPNSVRGWWVSKYYEPHVPPEYRAWPHRQALLRQGFAAVQADVLCLQEIIPDSFGDDLAFLHGAGYDHALHKKGDLRCATFWRRERLTLATEPQHKDRTLITSLRSLAAPGRCAHVINAHLKAGADPARRLRQVSEALEHAHKAAQSLGGELGGEPARAPVVLCGDFNSEARGSAVERLLRQGEVGPELREAAYPDQELTSRPRKNPFGPFDDAYELAYGEGKSPATLLLPDRDALFFDPTGAPTATFTAAVHALFERFAGKNERMDHAAVEAWITTVNGQPGRGSEWDKAVEIMARRGDQSLTEGDLRQLYESELREGKPWGVVHDLALCSAEVAAPPPRLFEARYDQIHFTALSLAAVRKPLDDERWRLVHEQRQTLPNAWHPSDHLPLGAVFRW